MRGTLQLPANAGRSNPLGTHSDSPVRSHAFIHSRAVQPIRIPRPNVEPKSIADVVERARRTLAICQIGLKDLIESTDFTRQIAGITTVTVQGRAVTQVAQQLRKFDAGFDDWYAPYLAEMTRDPLLRYFYELRTLILKEGAPKVLVTNSLDPRSRPLEGLGSTGPIPGIENYADYFKSGYLDTGIFKTKPTYVALPVAQNTNVVLVLPNNPFEHKGQTIIDVSAQGLCILYVAYLGDFVRDLIARFTSPFSATP